MLKPQYTLLALALAFTVSAAHAQTASPASGTNPNVTGVTGGNVTEVFTLRDLINKRGRIIVGTNVSTTVEFDDNIAEWIVGRDDLMIEPAISKVNPNRLYLRAKAGSGSSNLDVTLAGGQTALFTFVIDAKLSEGKRYLIRNQAPAPASATTSSAPSTTSGAPDWLKFNVSASASENFMSINYNLTNGGDGEIVADASKLALTVDGRAAAYKLSRQTTGTSNVILKPKAVQNGNIVFDAGSNVKLSWTLTDSRTRKQFVLERDITVARSKPNAVPARAATKPATPSAKPTSNAKPATVATLPGSAQTLNITSSNAGQPKAIPVIASGTAAAATNEIGAVLPIFDFIGIPVYTAVFSRSEAPKNILVYFTANTIDADRTTLTLEVNNIGQTPLTFDTADARIHVLSPTGVNLASYIVKREIRELAAGKSWQLSGIVVTGPLKNINLTLRWTLESFEFERNIITFG